MQCKHVLEHKGGRWWCCQPMNHDGPHDPMPGDGVRRERKAPPTRLEDEEPRPQMKKTAKPREAPPAAAAENAPVCMPYVPVHAPPVGAEPLAGAPSSSRAGGDRGSAGPAASTTAR